LEVAAELLPFEKLDFIALPANWRESPAPPDIARYGDDFVQHGKHCLLLVPSVLATDEKNCLINPAHQDFRRIVLQEAESLNYDPRMFRKKASPRRR
jgi:RES domain-containing protein